MGQQNLTMFSVKSVLACAMSEIEVFGWTTVRAARDRGTNSTVSWVIRHLTERDTDDVKDRVKQIIEYAEANNIDLLHKFDEEIAGIIEWVKDPNQFLRDDDPFNYKIWSAVERGYAKSEEVGQLAAVVVIYREYMDNKSSISDYIGKIQHPIMETGTIIECRKVATSFGTGSTHLVKAITKDGNIIIWWDKRDNPLLSIGDSVSIGGKVTSHSSFRGIKETKISRVKVKRI